jgi:hypothetical protein
MFLMKLASNSNCFDADLGFFQYSYTIKSIKEGLGLMFFTNINHREIYCNTIVISLFPKLYARIVMTLICN